MRRRVDRGAPVDRIQEEIMSSLEATFARRVIVISDLHLGGNKSVMMSRPGRLVRFLRELPHQVRSDEKLELVIAGDFVDFLTIDPLASWTPEADVARKKLNDTMNGELFGPVFDALLELVRSGCALTILLGNHDLELALPGAQEALWRRLSADPHQVLFLVDGRAYRVGGLLIEHGNRYDGANANDWEYLRLIGSAHSRAESAPVTLRTSFGSRFVIEHINPLKDRYPFLDLLQPQTELVALLLLAFEPELIPFP
jgi:UDP-2,3-diacylglucosamine pyrophosphatase LpxH